MTSSTRAVRVEAALEPRGLASAGAPQQETRPEGRQAPVSLPPARPLTSGSPTFKAVVRDSTGRDVWWAEGLAPSTSDRSKVTVEVPAGVFTSRNYTLSIQEVGPGGAAAPSIPRWSICASGSCNGPETNRSVSSRRCSWISSPK